MRIVSLTCALALAAFTASASETPMHIPLGQKDVTLVGAGSGFAGGPQMGHVIGIHAETSVDPHALGLPAVLSAPIVIAIDTEFDKKG